MKKTVIKWIPAIVFLSIAFIQCTSYDDYKKFMPDGELIYPQKADSVKIFSGKNRIQLEWIIVDPKVTTCQVFYEQAGIQGMVTVPIVHSGGYESNNIIREIIPNLEETNYRLKIISYDDFGHTSIPVETEAQVYGEMYERSLPDRAIKSVDYNMTEGLKIGWYNAEESEIGINLSYTDNDGTKKDRLITPSENATEISDFKITDPLVYNTMHKPDSTAIDTFYTLKKEVMIPYWAEITAASGLKNTAMPFSYGAQTYSQYYTLSDWTLEGEDIIANGNVNTNLDSHLDIWVWDNIAGVSPTITNGKIYQTIELEAGSYRFDAYSNGSYGSGHAVYVTAAAGTGLPNTSDVETNTLGFARVSAGIAAGTLVSCRFELTAKSYVSLGFVATMPNLTQVYFQKVELWQLK